MAIRDPYTLDRIHEATGNNPSAILRALLAPQTANVQAQAQQNQAMAAMNAQNQQRQQMMGMQSIQNMQGMAMRKHESDLNRAERERTREFQERMQQMSIQAQMDAIDKKAAYDLQMMELRMGGRRGGGGGGRPATTPQDANVMTDTLINRALEGDDPMGALQQERAKWAAQPGGEANVALIDSSINKLNAMQGSFDPTVRQQPTTIVGGQMYGPGKTLPPRYVEPTPAPIRVTAGEPVPRNQRSRKAPGGVRVTGGLL